MFITIMQKLPMIVMGCLLIFSAAVIYFRSANVTKSEFVKIFKTAKYLEAWVLIVVFTVSAFFGIFNHFYSKRFVRAVVSLNYSEASAALNSNGTRFNPAEITCDEVLERAIEKGAFENVTARELKKCLSVYPYVQGGVNDKSEYHISTEFVVDYFASKDTAHLDSENVVKLIMGAYKEYYIDTYTDNFSLDQGEDAPVFEEMEYMDIVAYFDKESTSILNYLYGMAEKGTSFVTSGNTTFNSIAGKVYQFKETQIEQNLRSLILQNGVSRKQGEYVDRLSYRNTNTDFDRQKNAISFELCNQAIEKYSEEMTRVVLVPTWDEAGKYYMGRTKVGIDELSVKATAFSDSVAENEKEIMDNNLIIGKMQGGTAGENASAEELIASIDKSIKNFATEAITAGREFLSYRMNQCIAVNISGGSLFGELKKIAVFMVFAYAAVMLYAISKKFPGKE